MRRLPLGILVGWTLLLLGCADNRQFDDLQTYVAEVKAAPPRPVPPLPEFKPYESFLYSAAGLREPFQPPVEVKLIQYREGRAASEIKPDLTRPKEYLESLSIDSLVMVGTIRAANGELWALVSDSGAGVHRVRPGNYLGRNHGRIMALDEAQIDVIEIVPDGHGGWLERPRSLKLQDEK